MHASLCRPAVPLLLLGLSVLPAAADPKVPEELVLKPLSLTVSKLPRDNFGKGVNPFGRMMSEEISGVSILALIEKPRNFKAHLSGKGATLTTLEDDKGKDLRKLPGGRKLNDFWEPNKPLSVLAPRSTTGPAGLRLRGAVTPSAGATKILAKGTLTYALVGDLQQENHKAVELEEGKVLEGAAAKLKLSKGKPGKDGKAMWWVEVRPQPEVVNVELEVFGKDEDDLLLDTDGGQRSAWRSMNGVLSYGLDVEEGSLHKVVIHYARRGEKVEVPFTLEVGLGDLQVEDDGGRGGPAQPRGARPPGF